LALAFGLTDANNFRHDTRYFGRRVELPFALAGLGCKVTHEIFIGVTENVIAINAVLAEVKGRIFKNADQLG
jgi:hypothetical protein